MKKRSKKTLNESKGTALITLLIFVATALLVTGAAVMISITNMQGTSKFGSGESTYFIAEAGIENAIIRLLRDREYTGETLTTGNGTATIDVTGVDTKTIVSRGILGDFKRTLRVVGTFSNNEFTISTWEEID